MVIKKFFVFFLKLVSVKVLGKDVKDVGLLKSVLKIIIFRLILVVKLMFLKINVFVMKFVVEKLS